MRKKLLAVTLIAAMTASMLAGCGGNGSAGGGTGATTVSGETEDVKIGDITYKKAKDITDKKITLTYFNFDQDEITQYLAKRFMEIYPNITVKTTYENVSTYDDTLLTMVNNKQTPDVIMYSDADFALSNMLLADISGFWDSDPETKEIASTINDAKIGCFGTDKRYAVPVKFFPGIIYVDRNVLKTLNIPVPDQTWTWEDMIDLIKKSTVKDSPDGMAYYGLGVFNRLDSYYGIASSQNIVGEFGFDGTQFDLSAWAKGEQEFSDLKLGGYVAPSRETQENEDWCGDWEKWCGLTGHVGVFSEAFWTYQGSWAQQTDDSLNLDIAPYVVPAVSKDDASADHHSIATIDFGGVTSSCEHPREAYELLKFMSFGQDGWKTRIEAYNNKDIVNASGNPLKYDVMPAPITTNQDIWDAYIKMYTDGMDDEHVELWKNYFKSCMQPIPFGWTSIAGYWNYCDQYFNKIGIHDLVDQGKAKAADYVDEATKQANYYHAKAMLDYFGEKGYNVLTDDQKATYEQMVKDNSN